MRAAGRLWHAASVGERQSLLTRRRHHRKPPGSVACLYSFHQGGFSVQTSTPRMAKPVHTQAGP